MADKDKEKEEKAKVKKETKDKKETKVEKKEVKEVKEKKETKKEEKPKKTTKKEEVKEVKKEEKPKKEKKEKVVEEKIEKVEAEVIAPVEEVEEEKEGKSRLLINIIAIILILLTLVLGLVLVFTKPSPKQAAKDFLSLSIKNPREAIIKYSISEFNEEIEREKGKYTTYKITKVDDVVVEKGVETVKVYYTKKGPNAYKAAEETLKNLEARNIDEENEKFNLEFLKEFKKVLKEKKDQLEEVNDVLTLQRSYGERNWIVVDITTY